ncbi:amino acid transporter [Stagonosporopsis vannaccii]|nr:amino acid transporter [Stagonosporopsis vannaccii]
MRSSWPGLHTGNTSLTNHSLRASYETADDTSKNGDDKPPFTKSDVEKVDSRRNGSVLEPAMSEQSGYKKLGRWRASLIYITNQVGIGILSLPVALRTLGLVPGVICIVGLGIVVTYTAYVLLQFQRRYPAVLNCVDCFRIIGGTPLAIVVGTAFVLNLILTCSSAVITMSIALNSISEHSICTVAFIAIPAVVSWVLLPCTISIFTAVLIVMIALGASEPARAPPGWDRELVLWGSPSFAEGFTSVLNIAFAYAGNQAFITVMAEMRDPSRDFMPSMYILQIFAIPMYSIVGGVIYGLAGQYVDSPALGTAPPVPAKVAYGVLLPTLLGTSLVFGHTAIKFIFSEVLNIMKIKHEYDRNTKRTWVVWLSIGTIFWILAFILANAIPLFDSILSVSSALFVSWFTFGISGVMWLYLNWDVQFSNWRKISIAMLNWTIVVLTLFMNGAGLWAAIDQLIAAFNDPSSPVNGPFTCADNSQPEDITTMAELESVVEPGSKYVIIHLSHTSADLESPLPQQGSASLLHLPAEIRNKIYACALGGNTWSINMGSGRTKPHADNSTKHTLALLQVNRQIYAEARLFPYLYNTFEGRHNGHLQEWIRSLTAAQRESIMCVSRSQRGYLIQSAHSVDVNPTFWMDTPSMMQWKLTGLKHIVIEVALHKWGWDIDEAKAEVAKDLVLRNLRLLVEKEHPGVVVEVALRHGY